MNGMILWVEATLAFHRGLTQRDFLERLHFFSYWSFNYLRDDFFFDFEIKCTRYLPLPLPYVLLMTLLKVPSRFCSQEDDPLILIIFEPKLRFQSEEALSCIDIVQGLLRVCMSLQREGSTN